MTAVFNALHLQAATLDVIAATHAPASLLLQRQQQRLYQRSRQRLGIFGAKRLRRQAGGAHTQEQQQHKQEAGCGRANGHAAQIDRAVEMANHGGIHQPQQRHGDI